MSILSNTHPIILIAEDHTVLRRSMQDLLAVGFPNAHILETENGEQAVAVALSHRPDAVLMDLSMPGIGGLEAARRIKKSGVSDRL